jgi:hypothetical protein
MGRQRDQSDNCEVCKRSNVHQVLIDVRNTNDGIGWTFEMVLYVKFAGTILFSVCSFDGFCL